MRPSLLVLASGVSAVQLRVEGDFQNVAEGTFPHCSDPDSPACMDAPEEGTPEEMLEPLGISEADFSALIGFIEPPPTSGASSRRSVGQSVIAATVLGCNRDFETKEENGKHPLFGQYVDGACSSDAAYQFGVKVAFAREYMKQGICKKATFDGKPFYVVHKASLCTIEVAPVCSLDKTIYINECEFLNDSANVGKTKNDMIIVVNPNAEEKWDENFPAKDAAMNIYCDQ